jgi:hypothetical protein
LHESKDGEFEDGNVRDDLQGAVLKETDRARIDKTDELVARIVEKCCRTLTRRQDYESLRFLELFEMAVGKAASQEFHSSHIAILTPNQEESLTKLFQDFRSVTKQLHDL